MEVNRLTSAKATQIMHTDYSNVYTEIGCLKVAFSLINLTPNYIISKTEHKYLYNTSSCDVTSNNTSLGLREHVILTTYLPFKHEIMAGKFGTHMEGGRHPWEEHMYQ